MTRIILDGEVVVPDCGPDETVLAALHRCGQAIHVGCRRGGCGVCKIDVIDGTVDYTRPVAENVLSTADREAGVCLTCRAVPTSDLEIRLRDDDTKRSSTLLTLYAQWQAKAVSA